MMNTIRKLGRYLLVLAAACAAGYAAAQEHKTSEKPPLHGSHWVAIAGKPLAATAGSMIFQQGGNAVDAACAMLAASATMWDSLGWGGETQALIHTPQGEVYAINALGVAPTGATVDHFRRDLRMSMPPQYGPLAAVTPGTPGGLLVMLAEFGTMSLAEVLAPSLEMARGYPMEEVQVDALERYKPLLRTWRDSRELLLPNDDPKDPRAHSAPQANEMFVQENLLATLRKLVETEAQALAAGKTREEAIMAAYDRFYRGDIAEEIVRATQAAGGLITMEDLDKWQVYIEEPVTTSYKDLQVYKLNSWVQGPALLQMLNIVENFDIRRMGYNSPEYVHTLYQAMNLALADRDFYYGDPYFPPREPIEGLLSKEYAKDRAETIQMGRNNPAVKPGDPYPYQGETNPFADYLRDWKPRTSVQDVASAADPFAMTHEEAFRAGTTAIQAADKEGWVVSMTPSGAWFPAFVAGSTGIGLSQRMQSFDFNPAHNPFNVLEPGKRPRATLTPTIVTKNGKPFLSFSVQGGDTQEQNGLQYMLNIVEFGMDAQEASEAANFNSYQVHSSFGERISEPGRLLLREDTALTTQLRLQAMGYQVELSRLSSGPINGIFFDQQHGTMVGGASNFGDDYGIAW